MKKPFIILAVLLAAVCAISASGCRRNVQSLAVMYSNWYAGTNFKGFQPTIIKENEAFSAEKITYKVTHEQLAQKSRNAYYSVSYGDGTYTTEFYADKFNSGNFAFPDSYKNGYSEAGDITAYCYKTELSISSVTFTLKSDSSKTKTFDDGESVVTECWFLSVKDRIRPLYSRRTIKSVTPNAMQPSSIESAYKSYDMEYEVFYNFEGTSATVKTTDNLKTENKTTEKTVEKLNKSKNAVFDLNSLDVAVRASNLNAGASLSQTVSLLIPSQGSVSEFSFAGAGTPLGLSEEATKTLTDELKANGLYAESENGLQTVAVSVNYSAKQAGGSQIYWFAAVENKENNVGRATLLKYSSPVSYYLGNLVYTLDKIETTLWNG